MSINVTFKKAMLLAATYARENKPAFIWGAPGIGKSSVMKQLAGNNALIRFIYANIPALADYMGKAIIIDIRLSMFDPVDLRGLPAIIDGKTVWLKPAFWPSVKDVPIFLFFDEMDRAPNSVKSAALQIVLDRRIGEHRLPDNVRIFAAGNGATDKGFAGSLGTALNDRFHHIDMVSDCLVWCDYADLMGFNPAVVAYLRMRGNETGIFHELNPSRDQKAFPTARSWESVSDILKNCPKSILFEAIAGIIGEVVASDFIAFLDMFDQLPDLNQIIASPESANVESAMNINYAISTALARLADQSNFAAILTYAQRLPREFEILLVTSATKRDPGLKNTSAFIEYATRNQQIFA